jgi:4-hydroxybenzoate polyprenyltransferase
VQRGLITLRQLKIAGAIVLLAQLALMLIPGVAAGWWWALAIGFSLLMYVEFFAHAWLGKHFGVYAVSHSAVAIPMVVALALRFTVLEHVAVPVQVWVLALAGLGSFMGIDVLRKTWAPVSEIEGVDSWSRLIGLGRAAILGAAILIGVALLVGWVGWSLGGRIGWLATVVVVTGWGCFELRRFVGAPTPKGEKLLQAVAGLHLLVLWLGLAVVAAVAHGAVIRLLGHAWTI